MKKRKRLRDSKMKKHRVDLAHVDKLAKDNNNVKYLVIFRDVFDRTLDAKGMKTKDSKETVRTFLTMITEKNRRKKYGSTRE